MNLIIKLIMLLGFLNLVISLTCQYEGENCDNKGLNCCEHLYCLDQDNQAACQFKPDWDCTPWGRECKPFGKHCCGTSIFKAKCIQLMDKWKCIVLE